MIRESDEIGRRKGLKILRPWAYGFDSRLSHQIQYPLGMSAESHINKLQGYTAIQVAVRLIDDVYDMGTLLDCLLGYQHY